jgi:queuine/archaeosine tRNA-ribosyltransferase
MLFCTLATLHNLRHYLDRMRRIRQAIVGGGLPEYLLGIAARAAEGR